MAKIKFENVTKYYGQIKAVNNVSFEVKDNEFLVIVGPSGSGKSTLLRMIAGFEDVTQGKIFIDDEVVNDQETKDRDVAMVFQNYSLYPHMTVYQNMAFGLKMHHLPKEEIDSKVKQAAEQLGISNLLSRKPKQLSGGQQQRAALGRALVRNPKVFLFDEPLSNLDPALRNDLRNEIVELHRILKTTFIYVTHDQTEAMILGDRVMILNEGKIEQIDTPNNIVEMPETLFSALFFGNPRMNLFNAHLKSDKKIINLDDINISIGLNSLNQCKFASALTENDLCVGISPGDFIVEENGNISAKAVSFESCGNEFLYKLKVLPNNYKINVLINNCHFNAGDRINLSINLNNISIFSKKTNLSLYGYRKENVIDGIIDSKKLKIGSNNIKIEPLISKKINLDNEGKHVNLFYPSSSINAFTNEDYFKFPIKVIFKENKSNSTLIYFNILGCSNNCVTKINNSEKEPVDYVYVNPLDVKIIGDNNVPVLSREEVHPNECDAILHKNGSFAYLTAFGTNIKLKDKPEYKEGKCKVSIKPFGCKIVYTKKLIKKYNLLPNAKGDFNKIHFSAYDEYKQNEFMFIYGKVEGIKPYATFIVKSNFSVYEMNSFDLLVPDDCFIVTY